MCIGKPLPENTSRDSVLDSQETSQETNSKLIPNILNQDAHPAVGKPLLLGLAFSCQGGKGEMSSVLSRSISDKPASGKPMLVDLERSESVSDKLASRKPILVTQQTITDSEYTQKSVPKCEKKHVKKFSLGSQERNKSDTVKMGSEHFGRVSDSPARGKPVVVTQTKVGSERSGRVSDSRARGKRVLVT